MAAGFTPWASLLGGGLIGLSAVGLMLIVGRIAGISGMLSRLLPPWVGADQAGRAVFVAGLLAAPIGVMAVMGRAPAITIDASPLALAGAGLLVGIGTVLGHGCTSGHGVCGLSRLSLRSLVATGTFMATAGLTVFLLRHGV